MVQVVNLHLMLLPDGHCRALAGRRPSQPAAWFTTGPMLLKHVLYDTQAWFCIGDAALQTTQEALHAKQRRTQAVAASQT